MNDTFIWDIFVNALSMFGFGIVYIESMLTVHGPTRLSFFKKSLLCISRRRWSVIRKAFLLPTRLGMSVSYLSVDCISISFHKDHISFGSLTVFQYQTAPFLVGLVGP